MSIAQEFGGNGKLCLAVQTLLPFMCLVLAKAPPATLQAETMSDNLQAQEFFPISRFRGCIAQIRYKEIFINGARRRT